MDKNLSNNNTYLIYKGNFKMDPFECTSCGQRSTHKYLKRPHPAIIKITIDPRWKEICRKCAQKEIGIKNKKGWEELHA